MDFSQILKEAGPYTAPLCGGMMFAIRWLLAERKELQRELSASQQRERDINEKRTIELLESAAAMGESAKVVEKALGDHDRTINKALEKWQSVKS